MNTLTTRPAQSPVETRKAWADTTDKRERYRRVLALMQARNEAETDDQGRTTYPAREALCDLLVAYMTLDAEAPSPHTERGYRRAVHNLFDAWHDVEVRANDPHAHTWASPDLDACRNYRAHLIDPKADGGRGLQAGSARAELAAISRFYAALYWATFAVANPWRDVTPPKIKKATDKQRDAYTLGEIEALRAEAAKQRDAAIARARKERKTRAKNGTDTRASRARERAALREARHRSEDLAALLLAAHGGLRAAEVVGVRWCDIDLDGETPTLFVPATIQVDRTTGKLPEQLGPSERASAKIETIGVAKLGKPRTIDMTPGMVATLRAIGPKRGRVLPYLSTSRLYRRLQAIADAAGVRMGGASAEQAGRGVHGFRHSCGTRMYRQTGDLAQVRERLGHADISTSKRYAKIDPEQVRATLATWT